MKRPLFSIFTLVLIALFAAACNMPSTGQVPPTSPPLPTQTGLPLVTITQPVSIPTIIPTQAEPSATVSVPTATSTPLPTDTPTVAPTNVPGSCIDKVKFIDDITIPDNTEMLPGQDYVKTWRLQNAGTCTWTNQYSLVFISGDQMNGVSPLPLTGTTAPNATLDVSASMKSPGTVGTYQGNWELQNPSGVKFGTGNNASEPFYVLIKVVEGVSELNLGNPTWTDNMDNVTSYWYLLSTANTKFTQGDGKLVMTQTTPGQGDEWGLSNKASMKDYYLQATFINGGTCSGLDKYGLLARAPDPSQGYVLEFSCDGRYRLYTWKDNTYVALQEWKAASPIKAGANQTNIMGIWMKGNILRIYANSYKLAEFTDSTFSQGQFGLVIGATDTQNLTINVDQVSYWDLTNQ